MRPGPPREYPTVDELKAMGRGKVIELARQAARGTGSSMVPPDDKGVRVFFCGNDIRVVLARGLRAYDVDDGGRRIETMSLTVHFQDFGPSITHEGDQLLTDRDREVVDLVLGKMPPDYEYEHITIIDDPKDEGSFRVELSTEHTMGRHSVDKRTGEWTYVTHKHYAPRPKEEEWVETGE